MTTAFTVRLPEELASALQRDAIKRGVTPAEILRSAVARWFAEDHESDRHGEILYEIAKTRAVLLRLIDRQHGEQLADEILTVAGTDAELYLQRKQGD
jgi:predicted transcriptional regulator